MMHGISLEKMKQFADALGWHLQALADSHAGLVARPQPHGGFHLTTALESGNVMQAKFNGFTVAVTHERRGEERLLRVEYVLEGEQVLANLWPEFESLPSRQMAQVLLNRFLETCEQPASRSVSSEAP